MARPKGSKDTLKRKTKRTDYEVYKAWVKQYGGKELSQKKFEQARDLLKLKLKSEGKSTTNLSRRVAQQSSFTYDYTTGRAIRKAYQEMGIGDISISEARRLMEYGPQGEVLREELDDNFWLSVSDYYTELKNAGYSTREAQDTISETIFGSP